MREALVDLLRWLYEDDPLAKAEDRARLLLLDTLGCYIAGQAKPEPDALAKRFAELEPGSLSLPGLDAPLTVSAVTFMLAVGACWDEACEGLARAHGRPGLHAIPPAVAVGLARNLDLGTVLRAIVTGYEVGGRMGEALRIKPGMHVDGAWGALGAAASATRALGGDQRACLTAVETVACQIPFSLYAPVADGKTARNTYVGHGATLGLAAGLAALSGIGSPPDALADYFKIALDGGSEPPALAPLGPLYLLEGYLKPHAAVRHVHYGAECALDWRREYGVETRNIEAITLRIYDEARRYCGNRAPQTAIQAQFSLTHGLARTLVAGDLGPAAYTEAGLNDPEVRRLEALTVLEIDEDMTRAETRGATLTVQIGGAHTSASVTTISGDPGRPFGVDAVREKFTRYAAPVIGDTRAVALATAALDAPLGTPLREVFA